MFLEMLFYLGVASEEGGEENKASEEENSKEKVAVKKETETKKVNLKKVLALDILKVLVSILFFGLCDPFS